MNVVYLEKDRGKFYTLLLIDNLEIIEWQSLNFYQFIFRKEVSIRDAKQCEFSKIVSQGVRKC